ncbi:MAG: hypothetical protein IJE50_02410 [Clostridia bacterium]|nr:hypothetical protein [Clostridia bacterium]
MESAPTMKTAGASPFPGRKHSIAPRFGYKQLTGLFALRVAPYIVDTLI